MRAVRNSALPMIGWWLLKLAVAGARSGSSPVDVLPANFDATRPVQAAPQFSVLVAPEPELLHSQVLLCCFSRWADCNHAASHERECRTISVRGLRPRFTSILRRFRSWLRPRLLRLLCSHGIQRSPESMSKETARIQKMPP